MKLSKTNLENFIQLAWNEYFRANKDPKAKYRFGQALWNTLPKSVTEHIHATDKDFYYWPDERVAEILEIAYSEFVG